LLKLEVIIIVAESSGAFLASFSFTAMGMEKRTAEEVDDEAALAARKAAKKAKKAAAAAEPADEEEDPVAAKKARKAAKAAAAAAAAEPAEEEDPIAAKKARKAAKKAAAAAADADPVEEEDPVAAKEARKAAKKAAAEAEAAPAKAALAKAEPAKAAAAGDDEEWKDMTYKCIDCSEDWIDSVDDQSFRYDKGFAEIPKRCKDCRWAKKVRMEGGDPTAKGKSKGKGKCGGDENTVFVRGLPYEATEETLNKDFGECGAIVTLRMPLNDEGSCKGFCFIKYEDKEGMDKAMKFNETDYGGRTIFCSDAAIKPEGKGKGKDGKDGKGKGKDKGKGKKGKKGKASSEAFSKATGAMVESTGKKTAFADSDSE